MLLTGLAKNIQSYAVSFNKVLKGFSYAKPDKNARYMDRVFLFSLKTSQNALGGKPKNTNE